MVLLLLVNVSENGVLGRSGCGFRADTDVRVHSMPVFPTTKVFPSTLWKSSWLTMLRSTGEVIHIISTKGG